MSRIYEALARAENDEPEARPQTGQPTPATALERYVAEGRQPFDHTHAPRALSPVPVRKPVAAHADVFDPPGTLGSEFEGKVLGRGAGIGAATEQYVSLATVLQEAQLDRGLRTLLVTSATPREGKTLTVVNLALTLSDSYAKRVLIIDADLRRPSVHRALGIAAGVGLSEALFRPTGQVPLVQVSPRLSVLLAGRPDPNPLARLSPERIQPLLEECASRFDWVLVDTPPIGAGADAQLLARFVQGALFVIRAGAAPYAVVERAIAELGRECVIGTVLNGTDGAVPVASPYDRFATTR
jgi:capsular exopolysaccharide synthesis family protein